MKLNVDGSIFINYDAGCRRVLRDRSGRWLLGFCKKLGTSYILMAELWVIISTLELIEKEIFPTAILESDSLAKFSQDLDFLGLMSCIILIWNVVLCCFRTFLGLLASQSSLDDPLQLSFGVSPPSLPPKKNSIKVKNLFIGTISFPLIYHVTSF